MNYRRPEVLRPLAERFVLGTMTRRARRRFGRLVDEHAAVAETVYRIEELFSPMAWALPPIKPSDLVWQRIARLTTSQPVAPARPSSRWPLLAAVMSVAFLATTVGWWQASVRPPDVVIDARVEQVPVEPSIGIFPDDSGSVMWVARIYDDLQRADITVTTPPEARADNDYQLWILRDDGQPVSLGLLPQSGDRSLPLDDSALDALQSGSTLAVSLEPLGGSPQAFPTGPVLYTTALLAP